MTATLVSVIIRYIGPTVPVALYETPYELFHDGISMGFHANRKAAERASIKLLYGE